MPVTAAVIGISAATSAYSAHKQATTAKEAAQTQVASGDKAIALQKQMWEQQQQRQQPYVDAGSRALMQLQQRPQAPPMPMFNGAQQGGGWTPQNFAAQTPQGVNPYAALMQPGAPMNDPMRRQQGVPQTRSWGGNGRSPQ